MPRYSPDYDPDDSEDLNESSSPRKPSDKKSGEALPPEPIIFDDLIEQFRDEYSPASFEEDADEQMDIAGMREYFGAWPQYGYPDAIPTYIDILRRYGFKLKVNFEHQPVLFLKRNDIPIISEIEF